MNQMDKKDRLSTAHSYQNKGDQYLSEGKLKLAAEYYKEVMRLNPLYIEAYINLAHIYNEQKHYDAAESTLLKALTIHPHLWLAHFNLGIVSEYLNKPDQAISCYQKVLRKRPSRVDIPIYIDVYFRLGHLFFTHNEQYEEALATIAQLTTRYPHVLTVSQKIEAYYKSAMTLVRMGRNEEALLNLKKIITLHPTHAHAFHFMAAIHNDLQQYEEAKKHYLLAFNANPTDYQPLFENAMISLLQGDYMNGLALFEKALPHLKPQKKNSNSALTDAQYFRKKFTAEKYWQKQVLYEKTVLVWTEQGLGDSLMMLRYLPVLKKNYHAKKIIVICEQPLVHLIKNMPSVAEVICKPEVINDLPFEHLSFDYHCSMMSLLFLTETRYETIPNDMPYLSVISESTAIWHEKLSSLPGIKIGLVWSGDTDFIHDRLRSIPLKQFEPLFSIKGFTWISLQKGEAACQLKLLSQSVIDWTEHLHDMHDTAALIENLDLVISVDTSVVHLAGALGRPTWLCNRYGSEWRWLLEAEASPWYPTVKIFRQSTPNDWNHVILKMANTLHKLER